MKAATDKADCMPATKEEQSADDVELEISTGANLLVRYSTITTSLKLNPTSSSSKLQVQVLYLQQSSNHCLSLQPSCAQ